MEANPKLRWIVLGVAGLLAAGAMGWSARVLVSAASPPPKETDYSLVVARNGHLEQSIPIRVTATWSTSRAGYNQAAGTVTSVEVGTSSPVVTGQRLYSVDLRPIIAAEGAIPMFRSLSKGDTGPDVRQLQHLLHAQGVFSRADDGIFGTATEAAVLAWQTRLGVVPTGVVQLGDVIFMARLPASVTGDPKTLAVGTTLSGGEPAVDVTSPEPQLETRVAAGQSSVLVEGASVELASGGETWTGMIGQVSRDEDGTLSAKISGLDGSRCGNNCPFTPGASSDGDVLGEVVVLPPTSGVMIPTIAISSRGERTFVVSSSGDEKTVKVVASVAGRSIVTGLAEGARVRIHSGDDS